MTFQFRLSTVQKIRENARDSRRATFAEAENTVAEITVAIRELDAQQEELREEETAILESGFLLQFSEVRAFYQRQQWLLEKRSQLMARLQDARDDAQSCHGALVEANKKVKTLEKLEEKQKQRHIAAQKKSYAG